MSRKPSTNNNISLPAKKGSSPAASHGLCLLPSSQHCPRPSRPLLSNPLPQPPSPATKHPTIFQAAFTPFSRFPSSTKHPDFLFHVLLCLLLQVTLPNTDKASPPQLCCPLPWHPPVPTSLLGEPGSTGTNVLLVEMSCPEDTGPGTSAGSSQSLLQHLFPNPHSLPKLRGSFSRDGRHRGQDLSSPHQLSKPWPKHGGVPAIRTAANYLFIHLFSMGKLPKSTLKNITPAQDTSPIRGCGDSPLWEQTGTFHGRVPHQGKTGNFPEQRQCPNLFLPAQNNALEQPAAIICENEAGVVPSRKSSPCHHGWCHTPAAVPGAEG